MSATYVKITKKVQAEALTWALANECTPRAFRLTRGQRATICKRC